MYFKSWLGKTFVRDDVYKIITEFLEQSKKNFICELLSLSDKTLILLPEKAWKVRSRTTDCVFRLRYF